MVQSEVMGAFFLAGNTLLAGVFGMIMWWLNRDKNRADVINTQAKTTSVFTDSVNQLVVTITALNDQIQKRDARLDRMEEEARQRQVENIDLKHKVGALTAGSLEKDDIIKELREKVAALETDLKGKAETIDMLQKEAGASSRLVEGLQKEIDSFKKAIERLNEAGAEKDKTIATLQKRVADLEKVNQEKEALIAQLKGGNHGSEPATASPKRDDQQGI